MKKYVSFFLIFLVIVVLHIVIIKLFFKDDKQVKTVQEDQKKTAELQSTATDKKNIPVKKEKFEKKAQKGVHYRVPSANPLFGKYFSYKNALWGNIKGLPDSAGAKSGILVNLDNRQVLWAKDPRKGVPIASMTKMMTLLLAFETLEANQKISLETPVNVSVAAQKIGGSQVYLDNRETHPLGELLKTVAIKSANDSAYQTAEFLSGNDIYGFVAQMNKRARRLRMPCTQFVNPHGLPNDAGKNSISSAEGMAILAEHLLEYPQLLKWTSAYHAYFRPEGDKHRQFLTNTNKLVRDCPGVDGMKTGYISASGFCITVTCLRGGKRLVAVVTGFKSSKARNRFVRKLLDWGYKRSAALDSGLASAK
jgi:D-alanyl-D-alanine carboxypeptidase